MYSDTAITWFGTVATILTLGSMVFSIIRALRPSKQMQELDATLEETKTLLHDAEEQGLLTESSFLRRTKEKLTMLQDAVLLLRSEVHDACASSVQDYTGVFTGLTRKVFFVSRGVRELRATISRSSAEARMRLQEEERQASLQCNTSLSDGGLPAGQNTASFPVVLPRHQASDHQHRGIGCSNSVSASQYTLESEATVVERTQDGEADDHASSPFPSVASIVEVVRTAPMCLLAKFRGTRTASA